MSVSGRRTQVLPCVSTPSPGPRCPDSLGGRLQDPKGHEATASVRLCVPNPGKGTHSQWHHWIFWKHPSPRGSNQRQHADPGPEGHMFKISLSKACLSLRRGGLGRIRRGVGGAQDERK